MYNITPLQKRFIYFLFGCIPTRLGLGFLTGYSIQYPILQLILGLMFGIISIGFITIFLFGLRKKGAETQGQPIWWNYLRPIHSLLYGIVAYLLLSSFINYYYNQGDNKFNLKTTLKLGKNIIIGDTIFGLISFIIYHSIQGNITDV